MASEQEVLQSLANLVSKQISGGAFQSPSFGDSGRDEKARAREAAKIMSDELQKGMKDLPKQFRNEMDKSTNKLAKDLAGGAKKIQDVLKIEDQIVAMKQISKGLRDIGTKQFDSQEGLNKALTDLEEIAKTAGLTLEELGIKTARTYNVNTKKFTYFVDKSSSSVKNLTGATSELEDAMDRANVQTQKLNTATDRVKKGFSVLVGILKKSAQLFQDELRYSMQRATADAGYVEGVISLGISQLEYAKILASSRHTQLAMADAGIDFKENLEANAARLRDFTANNEEAAQVANMFAQNAAGMGVSQKNLGKAVDEQTTMYLKYGRAMGMSAVEMGTFTRDMMADSEIRIESMRLREGERKQFILGIAQRQAEYKSMGYTMERAKAVQKTFAALAGMNPKERMKQAARKRAMMGAMGLGAEGAELMNLELNYQTMSPKQKEVAGKRMAELQSKASSQFLSLTGEGASMGQAMQFGMMSDRLGFGKVVETFETESGKGQKFNMEQLNTLNESNSYLKEIAKGVGFFKAAGASGVTSIGTGLLGIGGSLLGAGLLGKAAPGLGKMGMKAAGGIGGMFTGAKTMAGKGAGAAMSGAKIAGGFGKSALKSGIKKIPIIGALAALGFAASRIADGDYVGAGMEVASGVAGIIPGLGTAASFGIDAGLLARDLNSEGTNTGTAAAPKVAIQETEMQTMERTELLSTLKSIQQYLIATGELNSEQVKALDSTGKSIDKAVGYGNVAQLASNKRIGQS